MPHAPSASLTRRGLLAAGGALGLGALLAACGDGGGTSGGTSGGASPAGDQGAGPWTFTDDRAQKVSLDARPTRVVAYIGAAAALHDFGVADKIVGIYGPITRKDGSPDPQAGEFDAKKATIIGNAYGEFNIEKYAALRPQLLIDNMYVQNQLFYVPVESKDKIFALAPSIGISTGSAALPKPIGRYAELAAALGADLNAPKITAAKTRFDQAAEALRAAARAAGGLKVLAGSASPDLFYVSNPAKNTDLMYFRELGVDIIVPEKPSQDGYFEGLSWENADKYAPDLILLDSRTQALQPAALTGKPAWAKLPAVKAGQVTAWQPEPRYSYAGCAPILEALAQAVQSAKKLS